MAFLLQTGYKTSLVQCPVSRYYTFLNRNVPYDLIILYTSCQTWHIKQLPGEPGSHQIGNENISLQTLKGSENDQRYKNPVATATMIRILPPIA